MNINTYLGQIANESSAIFGTEAVVDKFRNNPMGESLRDLETFGAMEASNESNTELVAYHLALGNASLELEEREMGLADAMGNATFSLGNESIANKLKRGGYKVLTTLKDAKNKVVAIFKAIYKFFAVPEGRFKSFAKLFKKYNKMLKEADMDMDKELTIQVNTEEYAKLHTEFSKAVGIDAIKKATSELSGHANSAALFGALSGLIASFTIGKETLATKAKVNGVTNIEKYKENLQEYMKQDFTNDKKDFLAEIKDRFETEEIKATEAKKKLVAMADTLETSLNGEIKFRKEFDKLITKLDKLPVKEAGKKTTTTNDDDTTTTVDKFDADVLQLAGGVASAAAQYEIFLGAFYKEVSSRLQEALKDMAKVISSKKGGNR